MRCPVGQGCIVDSDCHNGRCDPASNLCRMATAEERCTDGRQGALESGVDCGGICSTIGLSCGVGGHCAVGTDCATGICDDSVCVSCTDGEQNGDETGMDCGGGTCPSCTWGSHCIMDSDCSSGKCHTSDDGRICVSCTNGQKDGAESDIDCGGTCTNKCGIESRCLSESDCVTGQCNATSFRCRTETPAEQCDNKIQDSHETDRNCGGIVLPISWRAVCSCFVGPTGTKVYRGW